MYDDDDSQPLYSAIISVKHIQRRCKKIVSYVFYTCTSKMMNNDREKMRYGGMKFHFYTCIYTWRQNLFDS